VSSLPPEFDIISNRALARAFQAGDWPAVSLAEKLRRRERMRIKATLDEAR